MPSLTKSLLGAALTCLSTITLAGPVSTLYVTSDFNSSSKTYVVQGNAIVSSFSNPTGRESAIAVDGDVRTMGDMAGAKGSRYDLAGNLLAASVYSTPTGIANFYDGTTDGQYNYTIDHNNFNSGFAVYRFDRNWSNGTALFAPTTRSSGITYDKTSNTLWTLNTVGSGTAMQQYSMSGALLSTVDLLPDANLAYALAYDAADDTFWTFNYAGSGDSHFFYQYSRTGALLSTSTISGFGGGMLLGAEFNLSAPPGRLPEPSALALVLLAGLAGAVARRRA